MKVQLRQFREASASENLNCDIDMAFLIERDLSLALGDREKIR